MLALINIPRLDWLMLIIALLTCNLRGQEQVEPNAQTLSVRSQDVKVRRQAIMDLYHGRMQLPQEVVVVTLLEALRDPDTVVRRWAVLAFTSQEISKDPSTEGKLH